MHCGCVAQVTVNKFGCGNVLRTFLAGLILDESISWSDKLRVRGQQQKMSALLLSTTLLTCSSLLFCSPLLSLLLCQCWCFLGSVYRWFERCILSLCECDIWHVLNFNIFLLTGHNSIGVHSLYHFLLWLFDCSLCFASLSLSFAVWPLCVTWMTFLPTLPFCLVFYIRSCIFTARAQNGEQTS